MNKFIFLYCLIFLCSLNLIAQRSFDLFHNYSVINDKDLALNIVIKENQYIISYKTEFYWNSNYKILSEGSIKRKGKLITLNDPFRDYTFKFKHINDTALKALTFLPFVFKNSFYADKPPFKDDNLYFNQFKNGIFLKDSGLFSNLSFEDLKHIWKNSDYDWNLEVVNKSLVGVYKIESVNPYANKDKDSYLRLYANKTYLYFHRGFDTISIGRWALNYDKLTLIDKNINSSFILIMGLKDILMIERLPVLENTNYCKCYLKREDE